MPFILSPMLRAARHFVQSVAFDRLVLPRHPVHLARTRTEREAVYRFRHRVYAGEQHNHDHPELDAARGWIHSAIDEDPATAIYYLGTPDRVLGTVRIRAWDPGAVPEAVRALHSLDELPGADELCVGDIKVVILDPSLRGTNAAAAMLVNTLVDVMRSRRVDLWFALAAPGLVRHYHKLGFDPHGGRLQSTPRGLEVSLVGVTGDLDDMRRRGSPIDRPLRRVAGPQGGPVVARYRKVIAADRTVCTDHRELTEVVRSAAAEPGHVLEGLSAEGQAIVVRSGLLLSLRAGDVLIRQGFIGKELYVIVDGQIEASRDDIALSQRGRGAVVGEVALLGEEGMRTARCTATKPTRVLALRHTFLQRLAAAPEDLARVETRLQAAMSARMDR